MTLFATSSYGQAPQPQPSDLQSQVDVLKAENAAFESSFARWRSSRRRCCVWWEPLGAYSEPGKSRQMYDDCFGYKNTRVRLGTSFTRSREDRFSEIDQSSPDNTSIYNSDGVLAFSTGAFAPGVTVQQATYKMWTIDGGLKKNGFSVNGQYCFRWVSDLDADGPLPLASTFDHGFELSMGWFIVPRTLVAYARGSKVFGEFASP